jgi:hypothetical protein
MVITLRSSIFFSAILLLPRPLSPWAQTISPQEELGGILRLKNKTRAIKFEFLPMDFFDFQDLLPAQTLLIFLEPTILAEIRIRN